MTSQASIDRTLVTVRGPLDLATAPLLRSALAEASGHGHEDVTVDFAAVTFCGPDVLGLLAATDARLRARGRSLLVRGARPQQARIFRLSGLGHLLEVGDRLRA